MSQISYRRHIAKAITWRLIGSLDTMLIAGLISGDSETGFKIGLIETVTKLVLYYGHERLWYYNSKVKESKRRHLYKTFSWRLVGTLDTVVISWIITGDPLMGVSIGLLEILTKMVLYYVHERVWYKMNFGIINRGKHKLK